MKSSCRKAAGNRFSAYNVVKTGAGTKDRACPAVFKNQPLFRNMYM